MFEVPTTIEVARPVGDVFRFLTDFSQHYRWFTGVRSTARVSDVRHGVGEEWREDVSYLGLRYTYVYRMTKWVENSFVEFETVTGAIGYRCQFVFEEISGGTRFTQRAVVWSDHWYLTALGLLFKAYLVRVNASSYRKLEILLNEGAE